jgi:hypothetical protein
MENELINPQEPSELKPSTDTLLVLNIHTNQVEMVKGIDKEGNLQKIPPKEKKDNEQLISVDKHGDIFSNFFSIFTGSLKSHAFQLFQSFRIRCC